MTSRHLLRNAPALATFGLSLVAASALGQDAPHAAFQSNAPVPAPTILRAPVDTRTYGATAMTAWTMSSVAFTPNDSSTEWTFSNISGGEYITAGHAFLNHSLQLPEGSQIVRIELDGCDNDNAGFFTLRLSKCAVGGPCTDLDGVGTNPSDTPGCGRFSKDLSSPVTVDNFNNSYQVNVELHGGPNCAFHAVRVYYKLQVSPAPATATFGDVPTDYIYFRAIEALAASGITSGCGGGNFCPNQNVTRGELAKFLANALGLHFAP